MTHAPLDHLALHLSADAYYQLIHTLRLTLPPPLTDSPEDLLRRDHAAIARIAALVPANATEADLAAQFVAASEQWKDCLRLAQAPEIAPECAAKCRAQAIGMMRQANNALRLLLRLQQARAKREADNAGSDRAGWTEHCAIRLMAEALAEAAGPRHPETPNELLQDPPPPPPQPAPVAPVAHPEPDPACPGLRSGAAEAEHYALIYPERAALIRALGRVPDYAMFDPPDEDVVQALLSTGSCDRLITRLNVAQIDQ